MPFVPSSADLAPQPPERPLALAAGFYVSEGAVDVERRAVFARTWQLVAHVSQVRDAGDHVVTEVAGVPLIVVRGEDGVVRALHNVCRHRAGPLAECDGRKARALRCRYHGWTYTLDGRLRAATELRDGALFDFSDVRLGQARLVCWRGLVFVALEPEVDFDEFIAQVETRIGTMDFSDHVFERRIAYTVDCNWKVYVDNYLEGYHLPHVHPGLNRLLDYRSYATESGLWHSLQHSPVTSDDGPYADGDALYFHMWPNTMLNILPGRLQTNRVVPLGAHQCRVDFDYSYPAATASAIDIQARDQAFSDEVQAEDAAICAAVQRGLASGTYAPGPLHPQRELAVYRFHEHVRRIWRSRP